VANFSQGTNLAFWSRDVFSTTPLEIDTVPGRHHVMFMARAGTIKAYSDRQRMANVLDVSVATGLMPQHVEIRLWAEDGVTATGDTINLSFIDIIDQVAYTIDLQRGAPPASAVATH
jgi:hypothetical protein